MILVEDTSTSGSGLLGTRVWREDTSTRSQFTEQAEKRSATWPRPSVWRLDSTRSGRTKPVSCCQMALSGDLSGELFAFVVLCL